MRPSRSEVWMLDLDPTKGREQAGRRPALVVSVDLFNHGPAELAVVIPITSKEKRIPFHVAVEPPHGGLHKKSYMKCEDVRSVSIGRLAQRLGRVPETTMEAMEDRLRILMGL